jgi:hypothetical protein
VAVFDLHGHSISVVSKSPTVDKREYLDRRVGTRPRVMDTRGRSRPLSSTRARTSRMQSEDYQQPQQNTLSGSATAEDRQDFAGRDRQVHSLQNFLFAERFVYRSLTTTGGESFFCFGWACSLSIAGLTETRR